MASEKHPILSRIFFEAREFGRRASDHFTDKGFDEAADICIGVLSKNIDELHNKSKSSSGLTKQEGFLLANLRDIKSEMEKSLCDSEGDLAVDEGRSRA